MESKQIVNVKTRYSKTRIAPTPSGFLHLGNVLSFAITAAIARSTGAKILLRIDDLDRLRVSQSYLQDIFDTLNFMEIPWDEGPRNVKHFEENYSQLNRMSLYRDALQELADKRKIFACSCSRRQLMATDKQLIEGCVCAGLNIPLDAENTSWRLLTGEEDTITVKDFAGRLITAPLPDEMKNFVVQKKDGFPAYQLASLIDDIFFDVDLIIRGEDLWPSTLAQHRLADMLEKKKFCDITFHHHPLIADLSGKKLSKSAGATSIKYLRESGMKAGEVYQLIAKALGIRESVGDWQKLAAIAV